LYVFPLAINLTIHWIDRVKWVAALGADVHIAVPDDPVLKELDLKGITLHRLNAPRDSARFLYDISLIREIPRVIRAVRPDLMHAATTRPVLYAGVFGRLFGVRATVLSVTGLGYLFIGKSIAIRAMRSVASIAYRFVLKQKNSVTIFENINDRDDFVERGYVCEEQTSVLVGGGVDLQKYVHALEPETKKPIVVLAGRLLKDKGVIEFFEAAKTLKLRGVRARFVLVGDVDPGNPATLAKKTIEGWVESTHIEWWGWRTDMIQIYQQCSLFCLPSYREGAPRTIIEAAAIGRATVATDVPGCRDVVIDGVTGRLVPARAVAPLADALQELIENPAVRREMGTAARRHAERSFSNEQRATELAKIYENILGVSLTEAPVEGDSEEKVQSAS
jgi:glycosyltransferase involved in cell wall biosynthesis